MKGCLIHLAEATLIFEQFEKKGIISGGYEQWKRQFIYGCLLPDFYEKSREVSHFLSNDSAGKLIRVPDLEEFLAHHKVHFLNPVYCGYYAHLYLESKFCEEYIGEYIRTLNRKKLSSLNLKQEVQLIKSGEKITAEQLFSEEYLYGDFGRCDSYFLQKYVLNKPNIVGVTGQIDCLNESESEISEKFEKYWSQVSANKVMISQTDMSVLDISELETLMKKCADELTEPIFTPKGISSKGIRKNVGYGKLGADDRLLLGQWKYLWLSGISKKYEEPEKSFAVRYEKVFRQVYKQSEKNKIKNFNIKKIFIFICSVMIGISLFLFIQADINGKGSILNSSVIFIGELLVCGIISKLVDIFKYQETWARHSLHFFKMQREMIKFTQLMKPYESDDRNRKFIENILGIWAENEEKFVSNIETKEKGLMDIFDYVKK